MIGLVIIAFIAAYLAISGLVVWLSARWAKKHNRRSWMWGGLAVFAMYNLVFWDWIPTVLTHKYYCATEAGFWAYKTPEQWAKENPGVLETLVPMNGGAKSIREGSMDSYTDTYLTNERFRWVVRRTGPDFPNLWWHEQTFVDAKNDEVLARYRDFSTSQIAPKAGWAGWKFWLQRDHCEGGGLNQGRMLSFKNQLRGKDEL